jgi:pyrrolidone-carboxylate peptidase
MNNIIITGFEKFGDYEENITEVICKSSPILSSHCIKYIIFPVRIFTNGAEDYGKKIIALAEETEAKAIISLGMASDVYGVRIESCASNWVENKKYCLPEEQNRVLDKKLLPHHLLNIDLCKWKLDKIFSSFLSKKIKHEDIISGNANNFCCNALIFRTLQAINASNCDIPYIYLHLPCTKASLGKKINFDQTKYLSSIQQAQEILSIVIEAYK